MLVELNKMEQRYDAVLAVVRDGLSVGEVAAAVGVTRQSIYRWMQRYEAGGLDPLPRNQRRREERDQDPLTESELAALSRDIFAVLRPRLANAPLA